MFYAFFGIPLYLLFLQAMGSRLLSLQHKVLIRIESRFRGAQVEPRYMNEKCVTVTFLSMLIVIFIGAGIQMNQRDWTFLEGVYCYFITFTTIGFGDFIPEGMAGDHRALRIFSPFYTLFGLVLMANIVNALVGCGDSLKALERLLKCNKSATADCDLRAEEENMDMRQKQNGGD